MKPTILYDLEESEYHATSGTGEGQFLTRSMLVMYHKDPPLFDLTYNQKHPCTEREANDGMRFGCYYEDMLLGGDVNKWAIKPSEYTNDKGEDKPWNGNAKVCREWLAEHPYVVSQADVDLAEFLKLRFGETALGKWWLNKAASSKTQVTYRWTDEDTGLPLQTRVDSLLEGVFISDLKSTASSIEQFNGTSRKYGYDWQSHMYTEGHRICTGETLPFLFAIGETGGLKRARVRTLPQEQVALAGINMRLALRGIAKGDYAAKDATETLARCVPLEFWEAEKIERETIEKLKLLD